MQKGFFFPKHSEEAVAVKGCVRCGLKKNSMIPEIQGDGKKKILIVTDTPKSKVILDMETQDYLKNRLREYDIQLQRDCWVTPMVNCATPKNREPKLNEIMMCVPRIEQKIIKLKPQNIILLGHTPTKGMIESNFKKDMDDKSKTTFDKWRGWNIPLRKFGTWASPIYHPENIFEYDGDDDYKKPNIMHTIFDKDLRNALRFTKRKFPKFDDERNYCHILYSKESVTKLLKRILKEKPKWIAFDYETTGLKPHAKGHEIVSCSIAVNENESYAFLMRNCDKVLFKKVMRNKFIKKIASNMKYEDVWTRVILKHRILAWGWDTMVSAHVQDNRRGITSIKFQSLIRYGIFDYNSKVSPYLKTNKDDGANAINRIKELLGDEKLEYELLMYNALDSLLEYRVAMEQMREVEG